MHLCVCSEMLWFDLKHLRSSRAAIYWTGVMEEVCLGRQEVRMLSTGIIRDNTGTEKIKRPESRGAWEGKVGRWGLRAFVKRLISFVLLEERQASARSLCSLQEM